MPRPRPATRPDVVLPRHNGAMTHLAYLVTPTPVGDALLVASLEGLVSLELLADSGGAPSSESAALEGVMLAVGAPAQAAADDDTAAGATLREAARQLDGYFAGVLCSFDVPLDWRLVHGFAAAALRSVIEIPYGETAGYGEVAIMAGSPGAARAVGTACAHTPWSIIVPVHRVVRSDGSIGRYGNNPDAKRFLIGLEQQQSR